MKTKNRIANLIIFLGASAIAGLATSASVNESTSPSTPTLPAGSVATVNGISIPQTKLDAAVQASHQPDTPQLRQALKQQLIAREVFRQNAEKAHYGDRPEVKEAIDNVKTNAEVQLYLKDGVHPEMVSDQAVKARYDQAIALLGKEEYRASIITVADTATSRIVLGKLKNGASFEALAQQYSVAPSKNSGGALPWLIIKVPVTEGNTSGLPLNVAQALTEMRVGATSKQSIEAGTMRVILKLNEKRPTEVPTFEKAQAEILQQLEASATQKAIDAFVAAQVQKASIQQ
ncbi:MAG: PpiC-type peptidyl-prolyl cis-trans isomerase [Herbaspirillum sp.]|nr:PpiC-type peptidyl-prolyl cis-trans isomerase [Herbaspirillum sp.]